MQPQNIRENEERRIAQLEQAVSVIGERNRRVEADKAWETSLFRVVTLTVLTYLVVVLVLWVADAQRIFFSALIPALGFFLSTQSLPLVKRGWVRRRDEQARFHR